VYSLGIVLYRLLTARYPVAPAPVARIREQLGDGSRIALRDARPDLPAGLVQAVERAAAPDPDTRFASAAALEQALGAFLPAGLSSSPRSTVRFAAMAAGLIVLVTIGTFAWIRTRPASHSFVGCAGTRAGDSESTGRAARRGHALPRHRGLARAARERRRDRAG
jgi:hypothetical protein